MNKLLGSLILMLFFLAPLPLQAAEEDGGMGFWVEAGTANASWLTVYWSRKILGSVGVYALVDTESDGYHEGYAGLTLELAKGIEVGVGVGRESIRGELRNSPRRNAWVAIDTDKVSAYATYENGGSGPWHKAYVLYKFTDSVSAGLMNEKRYGTGLRADYTIPAEYIGTKNATIWAAALRHGKETTTLLAVNFSF